MQGFARIATLFSSWVQQPFLERPQALSDQPIFAHSLDVLGPFQIGTREAIWGADPLEAFGGFNRLRPDPVATFPSSLAVNGTVAWSKVSVQDLFSPHAAVIHLDFDNIDWESLRQTYGWSAWQWQAWLRISVTVPQTETQRFIFNAAPVLEYRVSGHHFFGGDFYSYGHAPLVIDLAPGQHDVQLRVVRDVRAMGGQGRPSTRLDVSLESVLLGETFHLLDSTLPDLIDDVFSSEAASVTLLNVNSDPLCITSVHSASSGIKVLEKPDGVPILLMPGQARPISFGMRVVENLVSSTLELTISYTICNGLRNDIDDDDHEHYDTFKSRPLNLRRKTRKDAYAITYHHPSGIVSRGLIREPQVKLAQDQHLSLPILLQLHGAGVDVKDHFFEHAMDQLDDIPVWMFAPQGVTLWSGDDWHQWGFADIEAGIRSIANRQGLDKRISVDAERWIVAGHSNGGQGVWYTLTHHAEKVIAAAPISGYSSIQTYVPYQFWTLLEPSKEAVIQASLLNYRHELLLPNAKGIPLLIQHGGADDNVPTYHSRLMHTLGVKYELNVSYIERAGEGHWVDNIMTTNELLQFYRKHALDERSGNRCGHSFTLRVADPADAFSKCGVTIFEPQSRLRLAQVMYESVHASMVRITTTNVRCLELRQDDLELVAQDTLLVDDYELSRKDLEAEQNIRLCKDDVRSTWRIASAPDVGASSGKKTWTMDAILRSIGPFTIRYCRLQVCYKLALQVSRNLNQYFGADSVLDEANKEVNKDSGNSITLDLLSFASSDTNAQMSQHPIRTDGRMISLRLGNSTRSYHSDDHTGLGAIFIRPTENDGLVLTVWGADEEGLMAAARLIPTMSGAGQPEWVITTKNMLRDGVEGVLAMGFYDSRWQVLSESSFIS